MSLYLKFNVYEALAFGRVANECVCVCNGSVCHSLGQASVGSLQPNSFVLCTACDRARGSRTSRLAGKVIKSVERPFRDGLLIGLSIGRFAINPFATAETLTLEPPSCRIDLLQLFGIGERTCLGFD